MDGPVHTPSPFAVDHLLTEVITLEGGIDAKELFPDEEFNPNRSGTFRLEIRADGQVDLVEETAGS